jgi:hypothetical protein
MAWLAALALVPAACRAITADRTTAAKAAVVALAVLAIHPLTLQGSLLLDIDNTVFIPALLLTICAVGLSAGRSPSQQTLLIGGAWLLLLWTKLLPSAAIAAACLVAVALVDRRRLVPILGGLALGVAAFLVTFGTYLAVSGANLDVYISTFRRGGQALEAGRYVTRAVMGGGILAFWVGVPFLGLAVVALVDALRRFVRGTGQLAAAWIALTAGLGVVVTTLGNELPMGFPRYQAPLFVLAVLLVAVWLARFAWPLDWRVAAVLLLLAGYFWLVIRDPLLPQYAFTVATDSLVERIRVGAVVFATAVVVPFVLAIVLLGFLAGWRRATLVLAALVVSFGGWSALTVAQATANYATIYEYGRVGGWEAGAAIRAATPPDGRIVAPLELVYASGREGQFIYDFLCPTCLPKLLARFDDDPPAAFAASLKEVRRYPEILDDPALRSRLARCYAPPQTFGSYVVYVRSGDCAP